MTATQTNLRCFGVEYLLKDGVLLERLYIGASPSGKATDFDSVGMYFQTSKTSPITFKFFLIACERF